MSDLNTLLEEVRAERERQDRRFGEQNWPNDTGDAQWSEQAREVRALNDYYADHGRSTWRMIILEEMYEAFAESDPARLREELLQVAAVAVAWAQCIDRRGGK